MDVARHLAHLPEANSEEYSPKTPVPIVHRDGKPCGRAAQSIRLIPGRYLEKLYGCEGIDTDKIGEIKAKSSSTWVIPGYLVMFVFFGAALGAEAVVRERQNHTLERLLVGSARRGSILGGIYSGIAAKGLMQILLFWTIGVLVFHADIGPSPAAVILLSVLMVVMSSAFGVMLATLVKTQRSANSLTVLASLVLAPLGGCWFPLFIFPDKLRNLS